MNVVSFTRNIYEFCAIALLFFPCMASFDNFEFRVDQVDYSYSGIVLTGMCQKRVSTVVMLGVLSHVGRAHTTS